MEIATLDLETIQQALAISRKSAERQIKQARVDNRPALAELYCVELDRIKAIDMQIALELDKRRRELKDAVSPSTLKNK